MLLYILRLLFVLLIFFANVPAKSSTNQYRSSATRKHKVRIQLYNCSWQTMNIVSITLSLTVQFESKFPNNKQKKNKPEERFKSIFSITHAKIQFRLVQSRNLSTLFFVFYYVQRVLLLFILLNIFTCFRWNSCLKVYALWYGNKSVKSRVLKYINSHQKLNFKRKSTHTRRAITTEMWQRRRRQFLLERLRCASNSERNNIYLQLVSTNVINR